MNSIRRIIGLLLALAMVIGVIPPMGVRAEETEPAIAVTEAAKVLTEEAEPTEEITSPAEQPIVPTVTETAPAEEHAGSAAFSWDTEVSAPAYNAAASTLSGTCGDNLTWSFDSTAGTLTISGTGDMYDYVIEGAYLPGPPWHSYIYQIKNVVISSGVTGIGDCAFWDCFYVTDITIPEGVTRIGDYAFEGCDDLETVTIPESVTTIGDYAFQECDALTGVTLPEGLTSIGAYAFYSCDVLTTATIPTTVSSIGEYAFYKCVKLTSAVIPEGVTEIKESTFYGCKAMTDVSIPEGVVAIGNEAFDGCNSLGSVVIPDSVLSLGNLAFAGCTSMSSLILPDSLSSLGGAAFHNCDGLTSVTIPGSVTSMGEGVFSDCEGLTSVTILEGVPAIGDTAFNFCEKLEHVSIPASVASIGEYAFAGCALTSVTIPEAVTAIADSCFSRCDELTSIMLPKNVKTIGASAFSQCTQLASVTIPDGVEQIGDYAFKECEQLTEIVIPGSVKTIGYEVFRDCTGLTDVTLMKGIGDIGESMFYECGNLQNVAIGAGPAAIKSSAFHNCVNLTGITIPDGVKDIGDYAFVGCEEMAYVSIPEGVTSIGRNAFSKCTGLGSISIPQTVHKIGDYAFSLCTGLSSIKIPDGVTTLVRTFSGCSGLISAQLPDSVTVLGDGVFDDCSGLTSVNIPPMLTTIGEQAFENCVGLSEIPLPDTVTSIGEAAFRNCDGLTGMIIPDGVPNLADAFSDCDNLVSVELPDGLIYLSGTFSGCDKLAAIEIPDTVKYIASYALGNCDSLTSVNIPDSVIEIGNNAFRNSINLSYVHIPDSVTSIGKYAFAYCNLSTVRIPGRVTSIGQNAFAWSGMTAVYIPKSVTGIGSGAFREYNTIKDVYYEGTAEEWKKISGITGCNLPSEVNATYHFNTPMPLDAYYEFKTTEDERAYTLTSGDKLNLTFYLNKDGSPMTDWSAPTQDIGYTEIVDFSDWTKSGADWCVTVTAREPGTQKIRFFQADSGRTVYITVTVKPAPIEEYIDNSNIQLNGPGKAYAFYKSSPGVTYSLNVNGRGKSIDSNNKGIIRVPLDSFAEEGTHAVKVTFTSAGGQPLAEPLIFNAGVTVNPLEYSQDWEVSLDSKVGVMIGVGGKLDVLDFKGEAMLGLTYGAGFGNVLNASMSYSGKNRKLELVNDCSGSPEVGIKSGISGEALNMEFDIAEASADVNATATGRYGIRLDNYDEDDVLQQLAIAAFIVESAARVMPFDLMLNAVLEDLEMEQIYADCGAVTLEGSGVAFGKSAEAEAGEISIEKKTGENSSLKGFSGVSEGRKSVVTLFTQSDSGGTSKSSTSYAFSKNLNAGKLEVGGGNANISGEIVAMEYLGKDTKVELKKSSTGERTLETTSLSASAAATGNFVQGMTQHLDYNKIKFEGDSLGVLMNHLPHYAAYVSDRRLSITDEDLVDLADFLSSDQAFVAYEKVKKEKTLHSKKIGVTAAAGAGVDIGLGLSYMESNEYSTKGGYIYDDSFLVTSEPDDYSDIRKANTTDMAEIAGTAFAVLKDELGKYFVRAWDNMKKGVSNLWAEVKGLPDSDKDWVISVCSPNREGDWTDVSAIAVSDLNQTGEKTDEAITVGRPVVVGVTDANGEAIEDLSSDPLELTIRYTAAEFEAAGITGGEIAIYRYSDEGNHFVYVGGIHDQSAGTVTATINEPGQYTLAVLVAEDTGDSGNSGEGSGVSGDLNGNGKADGQDAVYLLWHILFPEQYPVHVDADYNQDGTTDAEDAVYLLWHTLFPDVYPLK